MRDQLVFLEELQKLDTRLIELEERLEQVPEPIAALERQLHEIETHVAAAKADHDHHVALRNEKRREFDLEHIKLRNAKKKESQIQTQREQEAWVRELSTIEQTTKELELQIQQIEVRAAETSERLAAHETEAGKVRHNLEERRKAHHLDNRSSEETVEELYGRRDELIERLEASNEGRRLLDTYDRIAQRSNDGVAVAETTGGVCGSCHITVPLQMYNELLRGDRLHQCPSCRRVLLPDRTRLPR